MSQENGKSPGVRGDDHKLGAAEVSSPDIIRNKLLSASSDSKASDSGISAEFNESTCNGSASGSKGGKVAVENGGAEKSGLAVNVGVHSPDDMDSPTHRAPCDSGGLHLLVPPSSTVTSAAVTAPNSAELDSSFGSTSKEEVPNVLNKLIADHLSKDQRWEPSGRYHANLPKRLQNLCQFEEDVSKQMQKKKKAREDARKVLELFLEDSLRADPDFNPSGRHNSRIAPFTREERRSTKHYVTSESSSPTGTQKETGASPDAPPRPLSPIPQVESAAERNSNLSSFSNQRNSYYDAIYFGQQQNDDCINEVTDAFEHNIRLASEESAGDLSPITLIPVSQATVTKITADGGFATTEVEATSDGIHIHRHEETNRHLSSSTSLSSILDDGGMVDLRLTDRKKKSIFKRASERLSHAFHRQVERSDSRSESETTRFSVRPRKPKKKKKKKRFGLSRKKSADTDIVDSELLQSHQHKFRLETTGHVNKSGLRADLWRDSGPSKGVYGRSVQIPSDRSQTLPSQRGTGNGSFKFDKEADSQDKVKGSKAAKKAHKTDRTESSRSNDSMFRFLGSKKSPYVESPTRERKGSFGLSSLIQRNKRKSPDESKSPSIGHSQSKRRQSPTVTTAGESLLRPPSDPSHLTSRSAEEITSRGIDSSPAHRPSLRLTPQHSRSRSAQDTTGPFAAPSANQTPDSSTSSHLASLSPTKQPGRKQFKNVTQSASKRNEIPRPGGSQPSRSSSSASASRSRHAASPPDPRHGPVQYSGGMVASAGIGPMSMLKNSLDLPIAVDANVSRTQSLSTKSDGKKVLRTVTSLDEMVSLGGRRPSRRNRAADGETDSEIERIIRTPQANRTSGEKDQLYRHIAHKLTKMVSVMESDEALSSSFNTPMDDYKGFYVGNIPAAGQSASSSGHTPYQTARSDSSSPSSEVPRTGSGPATAFLMADIPEQSGDDAEPSTSDSQITKTNISQLGALLRKQGDNIHASNPQLGDQIGKAMLQGIGTYEVFEKLADDMTTNHEPHIQRVAGVFSLTLKAIRYVGRTGELASRVKENCLSYIENRLASYILRNGGWDSVLEESSSEID